MKQCKNDTCTAVTPTTYCSRRCQLTTRNRGHRGQLPDLWVGMDCERELLAIAEERTMTVRDLLLSVIEQAVGDRVGWDRLDLR